MSKRRMKSKRRTKSIPFKSKVPVRLKISSYDPQQDIAESSCPFCGVSLVNMVRTETKDGDFFVCSYCKNQMPVGGGGSGPVPSVVIAADVMRERLKEKNRLKHIVPKLQENSVFRGYIL